MSSVLARSEVFAPESAHRQHNRHVLGTARSRQWRSIFVLAGAAVVNVAMIVTADGKASVERLVAGSLCLWMTVPPIVAFGSGSDYSLLFGPAVAVAYAIYFSRNVFAEAQSVRGYPFSESQLTEASWVLLLGIAGLSAALTIAHSRRVRGLLPRIVWSPDLEPVRGRLAVVATLEPIVRLVLALRLLPTSLHHPAASLQLLAQCAGLVVLCDIFAGRKGWSWHSWTVLGSMLLSAAIGVGGSLITVPLMVFLVPIFAYISIRRRVPTLAIAALIAVAAPLLYVRGDYRHAFEWNRYDIGSSARFLEFAVDDIGTRGFDVNHLADTSQNRLNMFASFAQVVSKTPTEVPLWHGETYLPALTEHIPRALWPDKSLLDTGQQFGHRFGLLDEDDYITSANMPQIVEARANFDTEWLFFCMFLIGGIQVVMWRLFDHSEASPLLIAVGASALSGLFMLECSFSLSIAPTFIAIPILLFEVWVLLGARVKQLPRLVWGIPQASESHRSVS